MSSKNTAVEVQTTFGIMVTTGVVFDVYDDVATSRIFSVPYTSTDRIDITVT